MIVYTDAFMVRIERLSLNNIPISQMMRNKEPISRCVYLNIYQMNCVFDDTTNRLVWFYSVERHFQQYFSYIVEHGDQFYWCLMPLSTMCQV